MNDESDDSPVTASEIIHGLIIGFAVWMVLYVAILIGVILSGKSESNENPKKASFQVNTTENHR